MIKLIMDIIKEFKQIKKEVKAYNCCDPRSKDWSPSLSMKYCERRGKRMVNHFKKDSNFTVRTDIILNKDIDE